MEGITSMLDVTDSPPEEVVTELAELRTKLDRNNSSKALDQNVLIGTWNLQTFGGLIEKWESGPNDTPKQDLHSLVLIAEIISRFDVIAVQEVRDDLKALRHLLHVLGTHWGLSLTDVTKGNVGNGERIAFLFDTRRVHLSGLTCELVVPQEQLDQIDPDALNQQFARTPYAVSFRSEGKTFTLITLHVLYGDASEERVPELKAIAE